MTLRIWRGPLRGRRWLLGSGGKLLRILNGTYERPQTDLFLRYVKPGSTVIDVGAHVGYYTLLASALTGSSGRVLAFEPNPANAEFLRRHVRANHCDNVQVEQSAVADRNGTAHFEFGSGSGTGHLSSAGTQVVNTVRLDDFCAAHDVAPDAVKIDVEGAEAAVLAGAAETLRKSRPVIFLSTHGRAAHEHTMHQLEQLGYQLQPIGADSLERCTEILATPA